MKKRLYHLISINLKTKEECQLTAYPMTHKLCYVNKSKFTVYKWRKIELREVK